MQSKYPKEHWRNKVSQYGSKDWANKISPFAEDFAKHLAPGVTILELGTGAGQDSLGFEDAGFVVTATDGGEAILQSIEERSNGRITTQVVDLYESFPFEDDSFDAVYSQLVLHYFDDEQMQSIMHEIARVLRPGGYMAMMVNSVADPEYTANEPDRHPDMRTVNGVWKRYFSVESLKPFLPQFDEIVLDNAGIAPKDAEKGIESMIRFIGTCNKEISS